MNLPLLRAGLFKPLQKWYYASRSLPSTQWLLLQLNGSQLMDTQPVSQGMNKREIHFPNGNHAQVILPLAGTHASDLLHTLGIQQPDAVIIIAGGASEMDEQVHPELVRLFTRGIAQVAASARALIIDGGTQAGVMAIMGQAVAEQQRRSTLLGVAPARSVTYPGKSTDTSDNESVPLDPNHSPTSVCGSPWIYPWGGSRPSFFRVGVRAVPLSCHLLPFLDTPLKIYYN